MEEWLTSHGKARGKKRNGLVCSSAQCEWSHQAAPPSGPMNNFWKVRVPGRCAVARISVPPGCLWHTQLCPSAGQWGYTFRGEEAGTDGQSYGMDRKDEEPRQLGEGDMLKRKYEAVLNRNWTAFPGNKISGYLSLFLSFFLFFIFRQRGREGERERNINVWLPLSCPLLETWPATQARALTGNRTRDPLVCRLALSPLSHTNWG